LRGALRAHVVSAARGRGTTTTAVLLRCRRSVETFEGIKAVLGVDNVRGVQEEVQLREQDFGNFQNAEGKHTEKAERLRFGRFFYRFPNGESGADVYDRITIYEDHVRRGLWAGGAGCARCRAASLRHNNHRG